MKGLLKIRKRVLSMGLPNKPEKPKTTKASKNLTKKKVASE